MTFKIVIGCLALGMTLTQASVPPKGHDGKGPIAWRLQDPPTWQLPRAAAKGSAANAPDVQVGRYTADSLTMLLYRFAFTDSLPIGLDSINKENETIRQRYSAWSGGRFRLIPKVFPTVFKLKQNLDFYRRQEPDNGKGWYAWLDEVKAAILSTGIDPDHPPKNTTIAFYSKGFGYNSSGGPFQMNLHTYEAWAIMHELGHTMGLMHACGLEGKDKVLIGNDNPADSEFLDYGNPYDNMGMG